MDSVKFGGLNINLNKNAAHLKELERLSDETMDSFHKLVERSLRSSNKSRLVRTDNNTPLIATKTYYVCADTIPDLIKILKENSDYFRMENIGSVKILSNIDYEQMLRKKYHIDEMGQIYIENHIPLMKDLVDADTERNDKAREIVRTNTGEYLTIGDALKKGLHRK